MQAVIQYIEKELSGLYPKNEIRGFIRLILEHVCNLNYTKVLVDSDKILSSLEREKIRRIVERLKTFEPVQYVLGETQFCDITLKVNSSVLIPRPETEELVQWILETKKTKSSVVLDIGTGSGCIALALKSALPAARIDAIDFSEKALNTARENAKINKLDVEFFRSDIFKWRQRQWKAYDIIVSNPPYVRVKEKEKMHANVLKFEPKTALFVDDSEPFIFYEMIGEFALKYLKREGFLFFEINESFGGEMEKLVSDLGFKNIQIKKDIHGKDRMLRCQL